MVREVQKAATTVAARLVEVERAMVLVGLVAVGVMARRTRMAVSLVMEV